MRQQNSLMCCLTKVLAKWLYSVGNIKERASE